MLNSILKTILILTISITFIQCNDDDMTGVPGDGVGDCTITWTLDGVEGSFEPSVCLYNDNTLNLGIADEPAFLQVNNLSSTGEYEFGNTNTILFINTDAGLQLAAFSGSVTVTEISNSKASGTFSGTMRDVQDFMQTGPTYEVTNGSFTANF